MLREFIDLITKLSTWVRGNQKIRAQKSIVKVNLGCGLAVAPGWINIDGSLNVLIAKWPRFICSAFYKVSGANKYYSFDDYFTILKNNIFVHHNLEYGIPFSDESVDYIYTSHFIEHLSKEKTHGLLREAFRVLKKQGIIRICVPDLAYAIDLYHKGRKGEMLDKYFFVEELGYFARHKYMYDFDLMKRVLVESGFSEV